MIKKILMVLLSLFLVGCSSTSTTPKEEYPPKVSVNDSVETIDEDGIYTSKDDVALYLHTYNHLPDNFITKNQAKKLGWTGGGLDAYAKDKCIGGDRFGNYEGTLPTEDNYHECDIDTLNASSRGAKRIVYSDDGDIYYTEDHYNTFTLLYEGE